MLSFNQRLEKNVNIHIKKGSIGNIYYGSLNCYGRRWASSCMYHLIIRYNKN